MTGGSISSRNPSILINHQEYSPPGYRNEFTLLNNGVLQSNRRFASFGLVNLEGIYPNAAHWFKDSSITIRTLFCVTDQENMLNSFSMVSLTNHDGEPNGSVAQFVLGEQADIQLDADHIGLQSVDQVFVNPASTRIGVGFAGDLDSDDANEQGCSLSWCDNSLFNQDMANQDRGFYLDSISIGGFAAREHVETIDPDLLDDYFAAAPRAYNYVVIWLGQNATTDEWTGKLQPIWGKRIEALGDRAIQAAIDSGSKTIPTPILVTPPLADGFFPFNRFVAMNEELAAISDRRGWGHIDLYSLLGQSLSSFDIAYDGPGPHPTAEGAYFLATEWYDYLNCIRTEFSGDQRRNFFDISAYLELYAHQDSQTDMNGDGVINFFDISEFLSEFALSCD